MEVTQIFLPQVISKKMEINWLSEERKETKNEVLLEQTSLKSCSKMSVHSVLLIVLSAEVWQFTIQGARKALR